jgi:hypothetical protein
MTTARTVMVAALPSTELPADLAGYAGEVADRKIRRFLDPTALGPFVAAAEVYRRSPVCSPDLVALHTVSGWDPAPVGPASAVDCEEATREGLSRLYYEPANTTAWLRRMPNSPLCQASIAMGFRGPSVHFVGDSRTLRLALLLADRALLDGAAGLALIVAFDNPPGEAGLPPDETTSRAAAVALAPAEQGASQPAVAFGDLVVEPGLPATDALDAWLRLARMDRDVDLARRGAIDA